MTIRHPLQLSTFLQGLAAMPELVTLCNGISNPPSFAKCHRSPILPFVASCHSQSCFEALQTSDGVDVAKNRIWKVWVPGCKTCKFTTTAELHCTGPYELSPMVFPGPRCVETPARTREFSFKMHLGISEIWAHSMFLFFFHTSSD